jgi:hypothetical protein
VESEIYDYNVESVALENGRTVAHILAAPEDEGWPQWRLSFDTVSMVLLTIEEVDAAQYENPFGGDAWMAKLNQFHRAILHDFPKIPDTLQNESRNISGGGNSTPGFTQTITFGSGQVTAALSRTDAVSGLTQQTTIVWRAGAPWWSTARMTLGPDLQVEGILLP